MVGWLAAHRYRLLVARPCIGAAAGQARLHPSVRRHPISGTRRTRPGGKGG